MTADDLPAALASMPPEWGRRLAGWTPALRERIVQCVREVSGQRPIAPPDPLRALRFGGPEHVRVVILGQDPYPTAGHADGLAFSAGYGRPRSLQRIFEVMAADRPGWTPPVRWVLDGWARQGVLLLNPTLTVEVGRSGSHQGCGWEILTSAVILCLAEVKRPPAFLLWGSQAHAFFDQAWPSEVAAPVLRTRHPSYDFKREFMADGSHFLQTADRVDWWAL